jgi:hexosaminidase
MARYKLNKFHFHLTDDEGWRLEIAGLPELTSIGAVRGHSAKPGVRLQPAYGSGPDPRDPSGSGYFSRADYIEILRYAQARHIEVIPEIEMPGHARAAVQAMEARYHRMKAAGRKDAAQYLLNDLEDRSSYRSAQYYTDNVINPGLDSTFSFIDHVVAQIVALHREAGVPLRTIHMGGDELANGAWERSPASLARMRKEKLASTEDLWDYFYDRVDGILRRHGLSTSGWEELAARKTKLAGRNKLIPNPRFTTARLHRLGVEQHARRRGPRQPPGQRRLRHRAGAGVGHVPGHGGQPESGGAGRQLERLRRAGHRLRLHPLRHAEECRRDCTRQARTA